MFPNERLQYMKTTKQKELTGDQGAKIGLPGLEGRMGS